MNDKDNSQTSFVKVKILYLFTDPNGELDKLIINYTKQIKTGWKVKTRDNKYSLGTIGEKISRGSLLGYEVIIDSGALVFAISQIQMGGELRVIIPEK